MDSGWLLKQGNSIRKGWRLRWFWVDAESHCLKYAEKQGDKILGSISFATVQAKPNNSSSKPFAIDFVTPNRIYYVAAKSQEEQTAWIELFRRAIKAAIDGVPLETKSLLVSSSNQNTPTTLTPCDSPSFGEASSSSMASSRSRENLVSSAVASASGKWSSSAPGSATLSDYLNEQNQHSPVLTRVISAWNSFKSSSEKGVLLLKDTYTGQYLRKYVEIRGDNLFLYSNEAKALQHRNSSSPILLTMCQVRVGILDTPNSMETSTSPHDSSQSSIIPADGDDIGQRTFAVVTPTSTLYFMGHDVAEATKWIRVFRQVQQLSKERARADTILNQAPEQTSPLFSKLQMVISPKVNHYLLQQDENANLNLVTPEPRGTGESPGGIRLPINPSPPHNNTPPPTHDKPHPPSVLPPNVWNPISKSVGPPSTPPPAAPGSSNSAPNSGVLKGPNTNNNGAGFNNGSGSYKGNIRVSNNGGPGSNNGILQGTTRHLKIFRPSNGNGTGANNNAGWNTSPQKEPTAVSSYDTGDTSVPTIDFCELGQNTSRIIALAALPENSKCADCRDDEPQWASINLGIFICLECSGIHRSLGTHISKVRSIDLDKWDDGMIAGMGSIGNSKSNAIYEAQIVSTSSIPNKDAPRAEKDIFIKSKYVNKEFVAGATIQTEKTIPRRSAMVSSLLYREGYLTTSSDSSRTWKERWATLKDNNLCIYKDRASPESTMVIPLGSAHVKTTTLDRTNTFELVTPREVFYLQVDNSSDFFLWMEMIKTSQKFGKTLIVPPEEFTAGEVHKSGWLFKQGDTVRNWKRRWFVLKDNKMSYYSSSSDRTPKGSVALALATPKESAHENGTLIKGCPDPTFNCMFELIVTGRTYYVATKSPEESQSWIDTIKQSKKAHENKLAFALATARDKDLLYNADSVFNTAP